MPTKDACQRKLFYLGIKLGVSPKLISTRLLSNDDKNDMVNGLITDEELECHVKVWMEHEMCDYANGTTNAYRPDYKPPMQRYGGNGYR